MAIHPNYAIPRDAPLESVIADALRAQRIAPLDPDLAAYAIDGALRALIERAHADRADSLGACENPLLHLDYLDPALARRFRLALRAPNLEARLDHLWALIDLLRADVAAAPHES
jgi:hypothetical protein